MQRFVIMGFITGHECNGEGLKVKMSLIPVNYDEQVYAGWLGKCIGVRFGAPIENWTYADIQNYLGELTGYLHDEGGKFFKPDDDTAVPLIFLQAFKKFGILPDISAQQMGLMWLNYLTEGRGTLWWGGYGVSTEHTAYDNLKQGIFPPQSGSVERNGQVIAEQIGGQIFSDIWGLIAPNQPEVAADFAERAASVSHGGNGVYGGRFIASMVSAAFSESDPLALIEIGLRQIPHDSDYARVVHAMIAQYATYPDDWHRAYQYLLANFGYDRYGGIVHIIPNAGVIALSLLYGQGDFSRTLQIANMCGWDTDCNVGNVGAIMGVAVGLAGIATHWREPMNDVLIAASNIGSRNIVTIPQTADALVQIGRGLQGESSSPRPRYHFHYAGSTQGFYVRDAHGNPIAIRQRVDVAGEDVLQVSLHWVPPQASVKVYTPTYVQSDAMNGHYYGTISAPLIYAGQTVHMRVYVPAEFSDHLALSLYVFDRHHGQTIQSPAQTVTGGGWVDLQFQIPPLTDACLSEVGLMIHNQGEALRPVVGAVYISQLYWDGAPNFVTTFAHESPELGGVSQWPYVRGHWQLGNGAYHGSGYEICESYTGAEDWTDYTLHVELTPLLGEHHAILARVGGALWSYGFGLVSEGRVAMFKNDQGYTHVAVASFEWRNGELYHLELNVAGAQLTARIRGGDEDVQLSWFDEEDAYLTGQIGLSTGQGSHTQFSRVTVTPNFD